MSGKARGGLGRGLGALIPQAPPVARPRPDPPIAESVAADLRRDMAPSDRTRPGARFRVPGSLRSTSALLRRTPVNPARCSTKTPWRS